MRLGIVLAVCFVKVSLGEVCGSRGAVGATDFFLNGRKIVESVFEIVDYELPALVVGVFRVFKVIVQLGRQILVDGKGNLLVQTFEQKVTVSAEEAHFGYAGIALRIGGGVHHVKNLQCGIGT